MNDSNFAIRLKLFMDALGLSSSQLADRCGIPRPSLSAILAGRNKKISDTLIGQIHIVFPQLSVLWLMFGEGEMFLAPSQMPGDHTYTNDSSGSLITTTEYAPSAPSMVDSSSFPSPEIATDPFISPTSISNGSSDQRSENLNFPANPSKDSVHDNLRGLDNKEKEPQSVDNKGIDGDLRTIALMRQIENMKANPRKVTQITIYYDDSTFETFFPART